MDKEAAEVEFGIALARFMMARSPLAPLFLWPYFVCPRFAHRVGVRLGRLLFPPRED